jgi:hypothetical protein
MTADTANKKTVRLQKEAKLQLLGCSERRGASAAVREIRKTAPGETHRKSSRIGTQSTSVCSPRLCILLCLFFVTPFFSHGREKDD